jgi:hypothetical protein
MPTPRFTFTLSPGEKGISESLAGMAELVRAVVDEPVAVGTGHTTREVSKLLLADVARAMMVAGVDPRLYDSARRKLYCQRVYDFLASEITFSEDPPFVELVRHPDELCELIGRGACKCDCDEVATLGAALLACLNIEPAFVVVGRPRELDAAGRVKLTHVFYAELGPMSLTPFDPQEKVPAGQWPPKAAIGRLEVYKIPLARSSPLN